MMHTSELDSAEGCTLRRFFKTFDHLTPWCDAHYRADSAVGCTLHTTELDSAVGCTPRSLTPRWDAHRGDWLRGMIQTAELFKDSNISAKSKPNLKILTPVYQGPRWVQIMNKYGGQKSRDTLPWRDNICFHWASRMTFAFHAVPLVLDSMTKALLLLPSLHLSSTLAPNFDMGTHKLRKIIIWLFLKLAIANKNKKGILYFFLYKLGTGT